MSSDQNVMRASSGDYISSQSIAPLMEAALSAAPRGLSEPLLVHLASVEDFSITPLGSYVYAGVDKHSTARTKTRAALRRIGAVSTADGRWSLPAGHAPKARRKRQPKPVKWPPERILSAWQRWVARHGVEPTYLDWRKSRSDGYPVATTVANVFGDGKWVVAVERIRERLAETREAA